VMGGPVASHWICTNHAADGSIRHGDGVARHDVRLRRWGVRRTAPGGPTQTAPDRRRFRVIQGGKKWRSAAADLGHTAAGILSIVMPSNGNPRPDLDVVRMKMTEAGQRVL
jgi:hypothetical protein